MQSMDAALSQDDGLSQARRLALVATAAAGGALLLLVPLFTWIFATRISAINLALCLMWMFAMIALPWVLAYFVANTERSGKGTAPGGLVFKASTPIVAALFGLASIAWMFFAQSMDADSLPNRWHWLVQLLFLGVLLVLLFRFFVTVPMRQSADLSDLVLDNAERRERVLTDIGGLREAAWLQSFTGSSPGGRLKAALSWWEEEVEAMVPSRGFELAEEPVSYVLDEARRQLTLLKDLCDRGDVSDDALIDAERRVIDSIELASRLPTKRPATA
jgi:hypothetical protein